MSRCHGYELAADGRCGACRRAAAEAHPLDELERVLRWVEAHDPAHPGLAALRDVVRACGGETRHERAVRRMLWAAIVITFLLLWAVVWIARE